MGFIRLVSICILAVAILPASGCDRADRSTGKTRKPVDTTISRRLAVASPAFLSPEMEEIRQTSHDPTVAFAEDGAGIAYIEPFEGKYRVVHNGRAGKPYAAISDLLISSDGSRVAYVANINDELRRMVVDGREGLKYGPDSNHWFTPDGQHHVSTVTEGNGKYIAIDGKVGHDHRIDQGPVISSDSRSMAYSVRTSGGSGKIFIIGDLRQKNEAVFETCGEYIIPSDDRSRLAVGCLEGGKGSVKVIDFPTRKEISNSQVDGTITRMKFSADNRSLSYTVWKNRKSRYVVCGGREEMIPNGDEFMTDPLVLSDPESVGVVIGTVFNSYLYRAFQPQNKKEKGYGYISDFVSSKDGRHHAYIATKLNEFQMQIVVDGNEGPKFDKIVSPLFSPDGRLLVYRARQAGKRFLVVSDLKGKIIRRHHDYAMVFQPVFTAGGKSVAYGVLDGNEFWWKVEKLAK